MQIVVSSSSVIISAAIISIFVILSRFITVIPTLKALKYCYRFGILSSISISQISKFSLVIVSVGYGLGHISKDIVSLTAIILIITSTISTYMTLNNHRITGFLLDILTKIGLKEVEPTEATGTDNKGKSLILLGCHRIGSSLIESIKDRYDDFLVVDFSHEADVRLRVLNIPF